MSERRLGASDLLVLAGAPVAGFVVFAAVMRYIEPGTVLTPGANPVVGLGIAMLVLFCIEVWAASRRAPDTSASRGVEFDRQQNARDTLQRFDGHAIWYCELCESVFSTFDMFYDHRQASDSELARQWATNDDGHDIFANRRKLDPGEEIPGTVGRAEPCEPTEVSADV